MVTCVLSWIFLLEKFRPESLAHVSVTLKLSRVMCVFLAGQKIPNMCVCTCLDDVGVGMSYCVCCVDLLKCLFGLAGCLVFLRAVPVQRSFVHVWR